jgi:hypothetical protein
MISEDTLCCEPFFVAACHTTARLQSRSRFPSWPCGVCWPALVPPGLPADALVRRVLRKGSSPLARPAQEERRNHYAARTDVFLRTFCPVPRPQNACRGVHRRQVPPSTSSHPSPSWWTDSACRPVARDHSCAPPLHTGVIAPAGRVQGGYNSGYAHPARRACAVDPGSGVLGYGNTI